MKVRYKFNEGDVVYTINEDGLVNELEVLKRLKRPFSKSDNFYFCSWMKNGKIKNGVRYEKELYSTFESALSQIKIRDMLCI